MLTDKMLNFVPMFDKLRYKLTSGKNNKACYFLRSYASMLVPSAFYRSQLKGLLQSLDNRDDKDYILERVNYYCKGDALQLAEDAVTFCEQRVGRRKVYYLDMLRYARYFPKHLRLTMLPGDINYIPEYPSIVKSRPVGEGNENGIILKLNAIRHFIFVNDRLSFKDKRDIAVFRGKIKNKPLRIRFFETFYGNPLCDLGDISTMENAWHTEKMTINEHLNYKFILALEGNDVASNLKWVMSSNSIAISTKPRFETWFMEGRLQPDIHYIKIEDDFSDLEQKIAYYSTHTDEAQAIIDNAHKWVAQFRDTERERLIGLLVLEKYFKATGQI